MLETEYEKGIPSWKWLMDQSIEAKCEVLPYHIKEDMIAQRCPSDVALKLTELHRKCHLLWGKNEADDWVSRAYRRAKYSSIPKEMCEKISEYLRSRCFRDLEDKWYGYLNDEQYKNGYLYVLYQPNERHFKKVGMIGFLRNVEDRVREIENRYGYWFEILYYRYTINVKDAESLAHEMLPKRINPKREFFHVSDKKAVSIVNRAIDITEKRTVHNFVGYLRQ
ncbi:MAG: GIY-YIG nuclease family protein [Desulfobacterales bacterium]|nr:GIY-YIG nuclease family protein [Desulfobacterales bacterium]